MYRQFLVIFQVPGLGHIPSLVKSMSSSNDAVIKSAVQVVYTLSSNEVLFVFLQSFILLHVKFLQFDWLRAVVFELNLKYLLVKITNLLQVVA